ncbi:MAG: 50S ribosomal protein L17 [Flavobacteriales bacterium]|nr:MAG: 50S ribosomal protein L17 [Flavobacteriales bacterium]MBE7442975.1 50S ribosomal protein L17 [Flavobacteriales bacterium]MBX2958675.1 50S ribosomal protein L17 [Flavobacteriales bacterium]HRN40881.1 50S ribosomal protein L17 [Vicingus sp.]HRP59719.1 50S ribosomal protein L17 [Vicingus sp.]
MRHGKKVNHLGRKSGHRKAMLSNMACSLIEHKKINTTLAKAKALKLYVEPLITKAKTDSTHSRRVVFSYLKSKEAVTELFRDVAVKVADRPGGYTRILKTGNRIGDNAEMCFIELVDYNENMLKDVKKKATSTRRRKPSAKKAEGTEAKAAEVVATEEPIVDTAEENNSEATDSNAEEKKD